MSVGKAVGRRTAVADHVCQFFDSDESRAETVALFVADGIRAGDQVLVVTRPLQWVAILERLTGLGVPADAAVSRGQLIVKDALDVLRRISRNDSTPAAARFDHVIGAAVRGLAERGPLRVYGEIVDILAQRNEMRAVLALESLWNRLADTARFSLLCGYAAPHFVSTSTHRALRDICAAHTDVQRGEHDSLAGWLLTSAHNPLGSSSSLSN